MLKPIVSFPTSGAVSLYLEMSGQPGTRLALVKGPDGHERKIAYTNFVMPDRPGPREGRGSMVAVIDAKDVVNWRLGQPA